MSDLILSDFQSTSDSPFDSIRQTDEQGNEFWIARQLMPLLGYTNWRQFSESIQRAIVSCQVQGSTPKNHFEVVLNLVKRTQGGGSKQEDYRLSRLGCYLVAMNGDPRKKQVAQAQAYFAIKTREAEVIIPAQNDRIRELELENENLRLKTNYMERRKAIRDMHGESLLALLDGRPDAVVEKVEKVTETIVTQGGRSVSFEGRSTAEVGRELGFKSGKEFERWLDRIGQGDLVCQGLRVNQAAYIPTERLGEIKKIWASRKGDRQLLIGE